MKVAAGLPNTDTRRRDIPIAVTNGGGAGEPASWGGSSTPVAAIDSPAPSACQGRWEGRLGIYIHIPFCARKCPYCDFNTYARLEPLYQAYTQAVCKELEGWATLLDGRTVDTVFLGGGTPTALSSEQLTQILALVNRRFALAEEVEFSCEANPGIEDRGQFALLRGLGVNRLSMGVQSFQEKELNFLGRIHSADDAVRAYETAVNAGFANINLDFMFGLPGQLQEDWEDTLDKALALRPRHLSLYSLIVEPDTPLSHWVQTGQTPAPDDDVAADLYEAAMARLETAGYDQYEVSNWARGSSFACKHNLLYWRNREWVGVGPGAHSHLRYRAGEGVSRIRLEFPAPRCAAEAGDGGPPAVAVRWSNRKSVQGYIKQIESGETPVGFHEELADVVSMGETMMLGLRLTGEGVRFSHFEELHGQPMHAVFGCQLDRLLGAGLLEADGEGVRLTRKGLLIGNRVFSEFLA